MVGDVVGGSEVKEALGSGRTGLLFWAVQASGPRAVVRRRLEDDDLQAFVKEAAEVLALTALPTVERRKSRAFPCLETILMNRGSAIQPSRVASPEGEELIN